jgi:opacity protein-like surface antigen
MIRKFALTVAALSLAAFTAPVVAADLIIEEEDVPVYDVGSDANWEGAYIGGFLGYYPQDPSFYVGGQVGYNFLVSESFLLGIQASGLVSPDGGYIEGWLDGHAGVAFDNIAVYGLAGLGIQDDGDTLYRFGAGAEVMVANGFSIFAEGYVGNDIGQAPTVPGVAAGFRFHF